jgi:predicted small lipoprotein YifL
VPNRVAARLLALTVAAALAACGQSPPPAVPDAPAAAAPATPAAPPHPMPATPAQEIDLSGIAKADGGLTVAEVFAGKDQLAGQRVTFRGRVVKSNANIMGRNWLHVRDGSGADGTNDLTVSTTGLADVGNTVLVTGTVALNRDLGMGYQYDVIIEDATLTVE